MFCDQGAHPFFLALETIIAFAWEPNGSKFAVLHGEAPRISVSFYHVKSNGKIELISKRARGSPGQSLAIAPGRVLGWTERPVGGWWWHRGRLLRRTGLLCTPEQRCLW